MAAEEEAQQGSEVILARVHAMVERMLGRSIDNHQVRPLSDTFVFKHDRFDVSTDILDTWLQANGEEGIQTATLAQQLHWIVACKSPYRP